MKRVGILVLVGVLFLGSNAVAQTGASINTRPTIVFVHGLWADGSCWSKIINPLVDRGYKVISVQNPTTSLEDDVAATKRGIDRADGDVILVGPGVAPANLVFTPLGGGTLWVRDDHGFNVNVVLDGGETLDAGDFSFL